MHATVANDAYIYVHFDDDAVDERIEGDETWADIDRVLLAALLRLLVCLGGTHGATIRKLWETVLWCV